MTDPVTLAVLSAFAAAGGAMWKKLSSDHAKLAKRSDDCEQDRAKIHEALSGVQQDLAVFKACPAPECPARAGLQRAAETFKLQSKTPKNPRP